MTIPRRIVEGERCEEDHALPRRAPCHRGLVERSALSRYVQPCRDGIHAAVLFRPHNLPSLGKAHCPGPAVCIVIDRPERDETCGYHVREIRGAGVMEEEYRSGLPLPIDPSQDLHLLDARSGRWGYCCGGRWCWTPHRGRGLPAHRLCQAQQCNDGSQDE